MNSNKIPKREILILGLGEAAVCAIICLAFLLAGKFEYTVALGALLGGTVTLLNFVFLSISVNRALDNTLSAYDPNEIKKTDEKITAPKSEEPVGEEGENEDENDDGEDEDDDAAARFARENAGKLANAVKLSYVVRTATVIASLVIAFLTKQFNVIATVIPLLCLRPILTVAEIIRRKEDKK